MRPAVTLSYAQTLDGSIARPGRPLAISGPESTRMTHALRAAHDAILVGIGTVLVDDPRLTVRAAAGRNPQPVVLDSRLRIPPTANLFQHPDRRPWLAATDPDPARRSALEALGASVLVLPADESRRVHLGALLDQLGQRGLKTLMVEGGATVITEFLKQQLADHLVVTIAPCIAGGLRAVEALEDTLTLHNVAYHRHGADMVLEADLR
jgi:riboflavin-specific deaminase-like protein